MNDASHKPLRPPPDVRSISDDQLGHFLRQHWESTLARRGGADDQMMVFGAKARARNPEIVFSAVEGFLSVDDAPPRIEIAAWFLAGYLTREATVPEKLVALSLKRLDSVLDRPLIRDPLLFDLALVARSRTSREWRAQAQAAIRRVRESSTAEPPEPWVAEELNKLLSEDGDHP